MRAGDIYECLRTKILHTDDTDTERIEPGDLFVVESIHQYALNIITMSGTRGFIVFAGISKDNAMRLVEPGCGVETT